MKGFKSVENQKKEAFFFSTTLQLAGSRVCHQWLPVNVGWLLISFSGPISWRKNPPKFSAVATQSSQTPDSLLNCSFSFTAGWVSHLAASLFSIFRSLRGSDHANVITILTSHQHAVKPAVSIRVLIFIDSILNLNQVKPTTKKLTALKFFNSLYSMFSLSHVLSLFKRGHLHANMDSDQAQPIICDPNTRLPANVLVCLYTSWAAFSLEGEASISP